MTRPLTPQQESVLVYAMQGCTAAETAAQMGLSQRTPESRVDAQKHRTDTGRGFLRLSGRAA